MKARVAIITEIIAPYRLPVFNALARNPGIDPHVIFLSKTDPSLRQWRIDHDEIQFSCEVLPNWRRRVAGYNLLLNWGLERQLEKLSPDILICGGYNYVAAWQAARWCKQNAVPLVLWTESTSYDRRRHYRPVEFLKKQFLQNCDVCVAAGRSASQYLTSLQVPEYAIVCAPDAVDNDFYQRGAAVARSDGVLTRRRYNLPQRYFLYVGRLVRSKGVFDLLEAYASLPSQLRSEVGLVFAGSGSASSGLEARAKEISPGHVQFAGFLQRDDLPAFYSLADMLVFPTHSDPWGLVVNEAMACGLPIITTSVAGCTADLVTNEWNGLLVAPGAPTQLAAAMNRLARSPELRTQFSLHSTEKIKANSPETCARGLAEAVRLVVGKLGHG